MVKLLRAKDGRLLPGVIAGLGVIWLMVTLVSIMRYPSPWQDEHLWPAVAARFLRAGKFGVDIWPDRFGLSDGYYAVGRLFVLYLAAVFRVFGVGYVQSRLAVALMALVSAILLGLAMRRLYSAWHGVAAAALYLFSWNMFYYSHRVRPEIAELAWGLAMIYWFLLTRESQSKVMWFGWGLANALLLDIHLSGVHLMAAIGVLLSADAVSRRAWGRLPWIGLGHAAGLLYWFAAHFLPDPAMILRQTTLFTFSYSYAGGLSLGVGDRLLNAFDQFKRQFLALTRLSFLQSALMLISALVTTRYWKRHWVILLPAASLGVTLFLLLPAPDYYVMMLMPWISAIMTIAVEEWMAIPVWEKRPGRALAALAQWSYPAAVGALFAAYLGGSLLLAWNNRNINYDAMSEQLREIIPPTANVMGDAIWYFTFPEGRFTERFLLDSGLDDSELRQTLSELFAERRIDYVLLEENLPEQHIGDRRIRGVYESFVRERCRLRGAVVGDLYGVDLGVGYSELRLGVYDCSP